MKCNRGDLFLVSFNPARGSEQAGIRPALIVQNDAGNLYASTTIVAAISTKISLYPQNVFLKKSLQNGLKEDSSVKLGQLLTLSQDRLIQKIGYITEADIKKIDEALKLSLGIF